MPYVELKFPNGLVNKAAAVNAAKYWNKAILSGAGPLTLKTIYRFPKFCRYNKFIPAGETIEGVRIFVLIQALARFVSKTIICSKSGQFARVAVIIFDKAKQKFLAKDVLQDFTTREIAHALGFGSLWPAFGLIV